MAWSSSYYHHKYSASEMWGGCVILIDESPSYLTKPIIKKILSTHNHSSNQRSFYRKIAKQWSGKNFINKKARKR